MKKIKTFLSITFIVIIGMNSNAQCTFTGLDSMHCSDAGTSTLVGTPDGGVFSGPGISGSTFDPISAGAGDHTITYGYTYNEANYYLRSSVGEPWETTVNGTAMDLAFGVDEWTLGFFEDIDPALIFTAATGFVFIDGSDDGALELAAFLSTNISLIEDWVNGGGRLLLNASPNEGGDIPFGFGGSILEYDSPSPSVDVVDLTHPAFLGPNTPVAATMTGSNYSHGHIMGTGFTTVLANSSDATNVVLCEKSWGSGRVMMGGMTTNNYHAPLAESANWRANLLHYMRHTDGKFYLRAAAGEPWDSSSNTDAMNTAFGVGRWTLGIFEVIDPEIVFSPYTSFVFIDGSDDGAAELNLFLMDNMEMIESWVDNGGSLLINAAPNEGGDIDFGFDGSTLNYSSPSSSVDVLDLSHPAYLGPNSPTSATMTGGDYAHAYITGSGFTDVLGATGDPSTVVLCEKVWGNGVVMMGGMTTSNYHSPLTESNNYRANLMVHMSSLYDGYLCTAQQEVTVLEPLTISGIIGDELVGDDGSIDITVTGGYPVYSYDWDTDGTGDFDDSEDLSGLVAGTYLLSVEDEFGCEATETFVVNSQVGIYEENNFTITLYPNPTQGQTTIEVGGAFSYTIMDLNGRFIFSDKAVDNANLDFSQLENGVYFVQISNQVSTKNIRVVKK